MQRTHEAVRLPWSDVRTEFLGVTRPDSASVEASWRIHHPARMHIEPAPVIPMGRLGVPDYLERRVERARGSTLVRVRMTVPDYVRIHASGIGLLLAAAGSTREEFWLVGPRPVLVGGGHDAVVEPLYDGSFDIELIGYPRELGLGVEWRAVAGERYELIYRIWNRTDDDARLLVRLGDAEMGEVETVEHTVSAHGYVDVTRVVTFSSVGLCDKCVDVTIRRPGEERELDYMTNGVEVIDW